MTFFEMIHSNLMSPVILSFILGLFASFIRSDLKIPAQVHEAFGIYLLFSIGLKGGYAMANAEFTGMIGPILATISLGIITPIVAFIIIRNIGKFDNINSCAIAAHYGSVSVVTFIAASNYLQANNVTFEPFMTALVAILEVPAIILCFFGAYVFSTHRMMNIRHGMHEVFTSKSILLLIGGLIIGALSSEANYNKIIKPFYAELFQGILCLFIMEMGVIAATKLRDFSQKAVFLACFAIIVPIINGIIGIYLGKLVGLSMGGSTLLGTMAASASYIAAPAAVRASLPQANPSLYLTSALGITFPFNISVGIAIYYYLAKFIYS